MSDATRAERILAARWLPDAVDADGEPWPGISAEGLSMTGDSLVIWLADEGMDDVGLRDHIVAAHNACHALRCPPDELEPRVRRLWHRLEEMADGYHMRRGHDGKLKDCKLLPCVKNWPILADWDAP